MCRTYLSVGWDGTLYDCDFSQMLEMPTNHGRHGLSRARSRKVARCPVGS